MMLPTLNRLGARRMMSAVSTTSKNRIAIAESMLKFEAITKATGVDAIKSAATSSPKVDVNHLPAQISQFGTYFKTDPTVSATKFTADPKAWQNLPIMEFVKVEYNRPFQRFIFVVGTIVALYVMNFPYRGEFYENKELREKSEYMQWVEGRFLDKYDHHDDHGHGDAHSAH